MCLKHCSTPRFLPLTYNFSKPFPHFATHAMGPGHSSIHLEESRLPFFLLRIERVVWCACVPMNERNGTVGPSSLGFGSIWIFLDPQMSSRDLPGWPQGRGWDRIKLSPNVT